MNKYILYALLVTMSFFSCSDNWLELEPKNLQTSSSFYANESDMTMAIMAAYDVLQWNATNFVGHEYHNFGMLSDILSDDAWSGGGTSSDRTGYLDAERGTASPASVDFYALYKTNFFGVGRANDVIYRINDIEDIEASMKLQLEGEARFLRALYYFRLVRMWGDLPLIDGLFTLDEFHSLPRVSSEEIYALIAADLVYAYTNLPESYDSDNIGRATKWAAGSLLMRVYLYHYGLLGTDLVAGDVTIDQTYISETADNIITSSGHDLVADVSTLFKSSNENNIESVFEVQYSETAQHDDWESMNYQAGNMMVNFRSARGLSAPYGDGWSYATCTESLNDEFESGDPRRDLSLFIPEELFISYASAYQNTGYFCGKYLAKSSDHGTNGDARFNYKLNEVLIRFADVLLMAAEINIADQAKALPYFNRVRTRSLGDAAALGSIDIDDIYHERRVELAGEGLRYWDLLRRDFSYAKDKIDGTAISGSEEFRSVLNTGANGLLPIPLNELDLMKSAGWVQNPGYN